MKKLILLSAIALTVTGHLHAELDIPKSVFTYAELDEAKKEASDKNQPLVFVYTSPTTECHHCIDASLASFEEFEKVGPMILVNHDEGEINKLAPLYRSMQEKAGNQMPFVLVASSDGETALDAVSYQAIESGFEERMIEVKKTLANHDYLGENPRQNSEDEADTKPKVLSWTNVKGQEMKASVRSIGEQEVVFVMSNGRAVSYKISDLSAESQEALNKLKQQQ